MGCDICENKKPFARPFEPDSFLPRNICRECEEIASAAGADWVWEKEGWTLQEREE